MIIELLLCPFYGGQAEEREEHTDNGMPEVYYREYHEYIVICKNCGASVSSFISMDKAVDKWNKRIKTKKGN